jgi:hypothetical protein
MKLFFRTLAMVLIALLSISVIGCGGDDDSEDDDDVVVLDFVGSSWEIVSINGEVFETIFSKDFETEQPEDIEAEQESALISNNWVFENDGSLTGNLEFKVSEKYPGPPATSMTQMLSLIITGTYTADEKTLKITTEDVKIDVDVTLEPKEVWAQQIQGKTVEQFEADLAAETKSGFKPDPSDFIFKTGIEYTWDVTEDTLTLSYSDQKMLLKKK